MFPVLEMTWLASPVHAQEPKNDFQLADDFGHARLSPVVEQMSDFNLEKSVIGSTKFRTFLKSIPAYHRPLQTAAKRISRSRQLLTPILDESVAPVSFTASLEVNSIEGDSDASTSGNGESKATAAVPVTPKGTFATIQMTADDLTKRIEAQRKLITDNDALDEAAKTEQLEQLNAASVWVQKAIGFESSTVNFQKLIDSYPKLVDDKKKQLEEMAKVLNPEANKNSEELQSQLQDKRSELERLKGELQLNQSQIDQREKRVEQIPVLKTAATERLKKIEQSFVTLADKPDDVFKTLSTLALDAQTFATENELESLNLESERQDQVKKLLPLERDIRAQKIKRLETEIKDWEVAFNEKRKAEIADQKRKAEEAVDRAIAAHPQLQILAESNEDLANSRGILAETMRLAQDEYEKDKIRFDELESGFKSLKQTIEKGMTPANGALLIEHRQNLTQPYKSQIQIDEITKKIQANRTKVSQLAEQREPFASTETYVAGLVTQRLKNHDSADSLTAKELEQRKEEDAKFESMATELVNTQKSYLKDLEQDYGDYNSLLIESSNKHSKLISKINESREYIDKNAMWIRSSDPVWKADLSKTSQGLKSFFNYEKWMNMIGFVKHRMFIRPIEVMAAIAVLIGVFVINWRLRESHA